MSGPLIYFAYGSNMCSARLRARTPSARALGTATLGGHALRFHKRGRDGSGKCDAFATGDDRDRVIGVVYALDPAELPALDAAEGLGSGYLHARVRVIGGEGRPWDALTYLAMPAYVDGALRPFGWYRELVLAGATEHGLPAAYVAATIAAVAPVDDPDTDRERRERAVL